MLKVDGLYVEMDDVVFKFTLRFSNGDIVKIYLTKWEVETIRLDLGTIFNLD